MMNIAVTITKMMAKTCASSGGKIITYGNADCAVLWVVRKHTKADNILSTTNAHTISSQDETRSIYTEVDFYTFRFVRLIGIGAFVKCSLHIVLEMCNPLLKIYIFVLFRLTACAELSAFNYGNLLNFYPFPFALLLPGLPIIFFLRSFYLTK